MTMAKAVLISIRPEWPEKILAGEKTLEVRKNRPRLEPPFKCYIYCTKDEKGSDRLWVLREQIRKEYDGLTAVCAYLRAQPDSHSVGNGRVVGEFVCDRIDPMVPATEPYGIYDVDDDFVAQTGLVNGALWDYGKGATLYGWHISELEIYDTPKRISQFTPICRFHYEGHECLYWEVLCDYQKIDYNPDGLVNVALCTKKMKRPPQSWCYVEAME